MYLKLFCWEAEPGSSTPFEDRGDGTLSRNVAMERTTWRTPAVAKKQPSVWQSEQVYLGLQRLLTRLLRKPDWRHLGFSTLVYEVLDETAAAPGHNNPTISEVLF